MNYQAEAKILEVPEMSLEVLVMNFQIERKILEVQQMYYLAEVKILEVPEMNLEVRVMNYQAEAKILEVQVMYCLAEVVPVMFLGVQKMSFLALMKIPEDPGLERWQEEEVLLVQRLEARILAPLVVAQLVLGKLLQV